MLMRSFLNNSLSALVLGAALMAATPSLADRANTISVNGEASISRAPDMATISVGVTTTGKTAAEALTQNSAEMQKVIDRLKASGVGDAQMQTSGLSVNPNWSNSNYSSTSEVEGFTAMNSLRVGIRDLDKLGELLDAVVADGANTLNGVNFGLIDPRPVLDEARKEAIVDARAKAELMAAAAGVKLGDLVSISEVGGYGGGPSPAFRMDAASVPVQRGEVDYQATVSMTWEIAD
ncbi:SIMPL domain-containing protein [Xinfangfangia sp. D13-10-4-6]|uniref:SIMPL domain-containing protein n=1 Tax=Pseudogemmobacter hezensis TaxID=2737662 RepID=UPI00155626DD|nr:SIMPL domain-containing protein [Pseudogemmobacter hezensis]NPD17342.1 SIMPL domain-containing protein [Pseudogemmobacter hezensis]